jgi:predicted metal-dependent peptidase
MEPSGAGQARQPSQPAPVPEEVQLAERIRKRVLPFIFARDPVIGSVILKVLGIKLSRKVPTAATDGAWIVVNPDFFKSLRGDLELEAAVLMHEAYHILLNHPERAKLIIKAYRGRVPPWLVNVLADAYVNEIIRKDVERKLGDKLIFADTVVKMFNEAIPNSEDFLNSSLEENVEKILKKYGTQLPPPPGPGPGGRILERDIFGGELEPEKGKGGRKRRGKGKGEEKEKEKEEEEHVVKEPSPDVSDGKIIDDYGNPKPSVVQAVREGENFRKMAGAETAGLASRLIEEALRPRLNWRTLLRQSLSGMLSAHYVRTWGRANRKLPELHPGTIQRGGGTVYVLLDTSGSISNEMLRDFLSEVYGIASTRGYQVKLIPWDAQAYEVVDIRMPGDVLSAVSKGLIKGGGSTEIQHALEVVTRMARPTDPVVILSDWDIFDIEKEEVRRMLSSIAPRTIAVTSLYEPPKEHNFRAVIRLPPSSQGER